MNRVPTFALNCPMPVPLDLLALLRPCLPLTCLVLGACAQVQPPPEPVLPIPVFVIEPPPPPVPPTIEPVPPRVLLSPLELVARDLVAYQERLRLLQPVEVQREVGRLSTTPASPGVTLQLALALGHTRQSGDVARALSVLDPLARSNAPELAPWQPWARLLESSYLEQKRLEESLERQSQQLRDSQRRMDQLNEKLEALRAIERSLTGRGPAAAAPSASRPLPP